MPPSAIGGAYEYNEWPRSRTRAGPLSIKSETRAANAGKIAFCLAPPARSLIVYLIVAPTILLHLAFAGCRVNLSLFALNLKASPLTVGIILSLLALLPMLFAVRAGRVIDRIGVRKPMLLGTVTVILGLVIAVAFPRVEALFAVSTIVGATEASYSSSDLAEQKVYAGFGGANLEQQLPRCPECGSLDLEAILVSVPPEPRSGGRVA